MADELWNRVNIPFPSAVSSVRVNFTSKTSVLVKNVLMENDKLLTLIDSEILQTEIRVLYELLYILSNSYRGNKTFKGLQQVEQCVNRLKNMKLFEALQELSELCPTKIQRKVGVKVGTCKVPSQPMLEWVCLKLLGAAHLMSTSLSRCSRAFLLCNQQMKWEEFLVLNMVITSMLSRLWVIFRGILLSLSTLYEKTLALCSEVAEAKPMPFLTNFTLPLNMSDLLDPGLLLDQTFKDIKKQKVRSQAGGIFTKVEVKEDLGVAIERDAIDNSKLKPYLDIFTTFTKKIHQDQNPQNTKLAAKKKLLKRGVKKAMSFRDMEIHLDKIIRWCKFKKIRKERRIFSYLQLKCRKMKAFEKQGHNIQRKLQLFRRDIYKACSKGSLPRTHGSLTALKKNSQPRTNFHSLRSQIKSNAVKTSFKGKQKKSRKSKSQRHLKDKDQSRTEDEVIPQCSRCDSQDDIDDIFASLGL